MARLIPGSEGLQIVPSKSTPQHALPDGVWQVLVDYHHPADTSYLAVSAERRAQYRHAERLYRRSDLADQLVDLAAQGEVGDRVLVF